MGWVMASIKKLQVAVTVALKRAMAEVTEVTTVKVTEEVAEETTAGQDGCCGPRLSENTVSNESLEWTGSWGIRKQ